MNRVVVVGGGWAGCAAALQAAKEGARVTLLERTDMILGSGLVGGIFRNNGRYTATEEMYALGGGELFQLMDRQSRHRDIDFPGHCHASLYDTIVMPRAVEELLEEHGITIRYRCRIKALAMDNDRIERVISEDGEEFEGHVFIDTTGTAGSTKNCTKWGNGCAMCVYRCPSFGGRIGLTKLAGIGEFSSIGAHGIPGAMSGSCKLFKDSLSPDIRSRLEKEGVYIAPIPYAIKKMITMDLDKKACQQYNLDDFDQNLVLLNTGHVKMMTSFFPLEYLKQIPGFQRVRMYDPYAGGIGNSIRFCAMAPRDDTLRVQGVQNLYCAGEKSGPMVGHTEGICTGVLAGHNAVAYAKGQRGIILPWDLTVGHLIGYINDELKIGRGLYKKYTFSGSLYFEKMKEMGLYSTTPKEIAQRVYSAGYFGIFGTPICRF